MRITAALIALLLICNSAYASMAIRCGDRAMLLERDGTQVIESGVYAEITALGCDRFAVRRDDRFAICDEKGALLTEFLYSDLSVSNGMIVAGYEDKYMLLNMNGEAITDMIYSKIVTGENGICWAMRPDGDQLYIITDKGIRYAPQDEINSIADRSGDGLLAFSPSRNMLWGFCDEDGRTVIPPQYSAAEPFADDRARVVLNGSYGVIAADGSEVVPFQYESLEISSTLIAGVRMGNIVDIYDRDGTLISKYSDVLNGFALFGDQYALFEQDRVRLFDANGTCLDEYPAKVRMTAGIDDGLILSNGAWGTKCVWLHGGETELWQAIIPLGYSGGQPVYSGGIFDITYALDILIEQEVYSIDTSTARYSIINAEGIAITDKTWESIAYVEDDRFLAETQDSWQLIDSAGSVISEFEKQEDLPHE